MAKKINVSREKVKQKSEIEMAFARLIGPLSIMGALETYSDAHAEIKQLLDIIIKWGAQFELTHAISSIDSDEILDVYNRLDILKEKFLFDSNLGNENELSDEVVIWAWEIMLLRKKQIEECGME